MSILVTSTLFDAAKFVMLKRTGMYIDFYFFAALLIFVIGGVVWRKFSVGRLLDRTPPDTADTEGSAILSFYTAGHSLFNVKHGKLNGMRYSFLLTGPSDSPYARSNDFVDESAVIYTLELPFNTQTHLLGLSKEFKVDRVQFEAFLQANGMKKVTLEGDFPDYFDIYATEGQDFEVRYVLDPEAMGFVVDYCHSHFWEINNAELYFVSTRATQDSTAILEESQKFMEQIKPALLPGSPNAPAVHHDAPYGEYDGPALECPLCRKTMTMTDDWQACPDGHGILINGRDLTRLHDHKLQVELPAGSSKTHRQLKCPNCHNPMVPVAFVGRKDLQIDSCEYCPFRWLDADDVAYLNIRR